MTVYAPYHKASSLQQRIGQETFVATQVVNTGLKSVVAAKATLNSDAVSGGVSVSVAIGSNGQITLKKWAVTFAASNVSQDVSWVAWGN